jgi:hypothetical protein
MSNFDKKISDAIKLYNSITVNHKIRNYKKINFKNLDSLSKMNLATSFEEVMSKDNFVISFGNNEKDFSKIFKDHRSLIQYLKKCSK